MSKRETCGNPSWLFEGIKCRRRKGHHGEHSAGVWGIWNDNGKARFGSLREPATTPETAKVYAHNAPKNPEGGS